MQLKQREIEEELKLINNQWKKTKHGYINSSDEEIIFYSEEEMIKKRNNQVDTFSAITGNDIKHIANEIFEDYKTNTRINNSNSDKQKKGKKEVDNFDVVLRQYKKVIKDMNLTFNEKAVYRELCDLCYGKENMVCIDDSIPTLEQLSESIGKKERTLSGYFKKLEDKGIIIREDFMHKKVIYINPLYYRTYLDFTKISDHTLSLFGIQLEE